MPPASSDQVRARMRSQRTRDTAPELVLRRALHAAGLRYRVCLPVGTPWLARDVRPDVVFTGSRLALFVDGCWWHRCPAHGRPAAANGEWWARKLDANRERDDAQNEALGRTGWTALRVWEHDLTRACPPQLVEFVDVLVRGVHRPLPIGSTLRWDGDGFTCEAVWRVA